MGMNMSDQEIEFGPLAQTPRQTRPRPDRNQQWAVVPCGEVASDDLPIFVDLDAMREMEGHARSDRRVELGGVLLGGQFDDPAGRPFVLVQESLRARYYENSKGSFKFTHDTWSDITSRREQFPPDMQMMGWYHTHPDWGVFLSGMDLFICEHFFNRPLDVALVIDPCRDQRGWFQWQEGPGAKVRPTSGFYLIASRHRRHELERYAAILEGRLPMTHHDHSPQTDLARSTYPVTVTNVSDPRSVWFALGLMGMLTVQLLVLMLLAWTIFSRSTDALGGTVPASPLSRGSESAAVSEAGPQGMVSDREATLARERIEAQRQLLDRVISILADEAPDDLVSQLDTQRGEIEHLQADLRAYRVLETRMQDQQQTLAQELDEAHRQQANLRGQVQTLQRSLAESRSQTNELQRQLASLRVAPAHDPSPQNIHSSTAAEDIPLLARLARWWLIAVAIALILVMMAAAHFVTRHRARHMGQSSGQSSGQSPGQSHSEST